MDDDLSKELERAIESALSPFLSAYGRTEARIELNPSTGTFDYATGFGGEDGLVVMEWPRECKDGCRPSALSVTVNVDYDIDYGSKGPNQADDIEDAFLQFQWGSIGHKAEVDLRRGVPVSLAGSRVVVRAFYPLVVPQVLNIPDPPAPIAIRQPRIWLKVSAAAGSSDAGPGLAPGVTRTIRYGSIDGGHDSAILAIPPWATGAILVNPDANLVTVRFSQFKDQFGINANSLISQVDLGKQVYVPIANNARFARVSNMGMNAQTIRVLYVLGIGA